MSARPCPIVRINADGFGAVMRHDGDGEWYTLTKADAIPDLVLEVWDLFHAGTITREERKKLHADIDAECGL